MSFVTWVPTTPCKLKEAGREPRWLGVGTTGFPASYTLASWVSEQGPRSDGQRAASLPPPPSFPPTPAPPTFLLDSLSWATRNRVPTGWGGCPRWVLLGDRPEAFLKDHPMFHISDRNAENMWSEITALIWSPKTWIGMEALPRVAVCHGELFRPLGSLVLSTGMRI